MKHSQRVLVYDLACGYSAWRLHCQSGSRQLPDRPAFPSLSHYMTTREIDILTKRAIYGERACYCRKQNRACARVNDGPHGAVGRGQSSTGNPTLQWNSLFVAIIPIIFRDFQGGLSLESLKFVSVSSYLLFLSRTGSCHKRQKPQAPTPQAPIRNRQTRKVANAKGLNRNTSLT